MPDLSDDERKGVLGEVLLDELKAIREGIANLPTRTEFNRLEDKVNDLTSDVKTVKAVVTSQSQQLSDHDAQINLLRKATA